MPFKSILCVSTLELQQPVRPVLGPHHTPMSSDFSADFSAHSSQDKEATKMPIDRWVDEEEVGHTHSGTLLSHEEERNGTICSDTVGPRNHHTERSKSERERQTPYAITYMRNLRKQLLVNPQTRQTKEWLSKGKGEGRDKLGGWD